MIFGFDDFELDAERLELRRSGKLVKADALVLRFLAVLVQNAGRLVTKEELVEHVWEGRAVADNVLTVSMARLRKTLGHSRGEQEYVVTVYGRGYRFVRAVVARSAASWLPPPVLQAGAPGLPFVGRERVLDRLRHALSEASAGRGRLCVLMGEPGIGKTRAVEVLERELSESQVRVAWGYCREAGDTPPLAPWLRVLREVMAVARTPELERELGPLAALVDEMLRDPSDQAQQALAEGAAESTGFAGAERHRGFEAILRSLALACAQTPWVLVLDDLHRADAASLELLSLLLDEIAHTRLLVIATLRHAPGRRAPRPETHLPQALGHRNCERIAIDRLQPEDVATYMAAVIEDPEGSLGRAVFAKSEGNPFYMVELARQLRDAERPDPGALALPDTALELIRQNLERLDPEVREMLSAAAVIGRSFELPLLAAVTSEHAGALMTRLDQALADELLIAAKGSMTAFAFNHELVRAVLYTALAPAERRHWHARVAQALEARLGAGEAVPPSELAYHCHAALPDGDLRRAVRFCRAAAGAAAAVFANPDVVRYTRQALEALDLMENPSVRLRMALLFNTALYARANATEFTRAIREVIRLAREHADGPALVQAASMLILHPGFQPLPGSAAALEHALGLLHPDDAATRSIALAGLATSAPHCYDAAGSDSLIADAEALARKSGQRRSLHAALAFKLYVRGGPRYAEEAAGVADELERLAQENPRSMPVVPVGLSFRRAIVALQRGDVASMTAAFDRAAARARELHHGELLWHSERFRALGNINAGAWLEGKAALEHLHVIAVQRPIIGTEPFCAFDRLVVFAEVALAPALDDSVRSALEYEASEPPSVWSLKLRALASAGLADEARAALRAVAPADLARLPCDRDYLGTLGTLARAALTLRALDYAEALHALLEPYADQFSAHVSFLCEGSVPQLLGMLQHALGRRREAAAQLEAGIQMNDRAGLLLRAAEARLQLARCLIDDDQQPRARAIARAAHEIAARLNIQPLQTAAAALLEGREG